VAAVARTSDRVIDVDHPASRWHRLHPWSAITGFAVLSDQQPLPIASVARKDSNTIRIAGRTSAPADLTVRYLYGAHPDTSNPVRDNTDLHLPLEPFSSR
jgi:hypothetical protein